MRFFKKKEDEDKEIKGENTVNDNIPEDELFHEVFRRAVSNRSLNQEEFIEQVAPGRYRIKNPGRRLSPREGSNEKAEKTEPQNRDEILLEILKELEELNSNVKALIARADAGRQEIRELAEDIYARLKEKLDNMTMGMGGW